MTVPLTLLSLGPSQQCDCDTFPGWPCTWHYLLPSSQPISTATKKSLLKCPRSRSNMITLTLGSEPQNGYALIHNKTKVFRGQGCTLCHLWGSSPMVPQIAHLWLCSLHYFSKLWVFTRFWVSAPVMFTCLKHSLNPSSLPSDASFFLKPCLAL